MTNTEKIKAIHENNFAESGNILFVYDREEKEEMMREKPGCLRDLSPLWYPAGWSRSRLLWLLLVACKATPRSQVPRMPLQQS